MKRTPTLLTISLLLIYLLPSTLSFSQANRSNDYAALVSLFKEWRTFENPPLRNGAPDYTAVTFSKRLPAFKKLQSRLQNIDTTGWRTEQKVDWMLVWAEMNGYDFNHRILQPWTRDPAFYKTIWTERSDVPAHEGPTHHAIIDTWKYTFPLSPADKNKLIEQLKVIEPLHV